MTLRSFIGLCEHRWQDEGQIDRKVRTIIGATEPGEWRTIEVRIVQRCTVCGKVRSVRL